MSVMTKVDTVAEIRALLSAQVDRALVYTVTGSASGSVSASGGTTVTLPGYCFFPDLRCSNNGSGSSNGLVVGGEYPNSSGTPDAPKLRLINLDSTNTQNYLLSWRYLGSV